MRRRVVTCLLALGVVVALSGCGGNPGQVRGKVTFKGKPVNYGTVMILGVDGKTSHGAIGEDGSFEVNQVAAGEARVTVSSPNPDLPLQEPKRPVQFSPEAIERRKIKVANQQSRKARGVQWFPIPSKYATFVTTDLKLDVLRDGITLYDIDLQP